VSGTSLCLRYGREIAEIGRFSLRRSTLRLGVRGLSEASQFYLKPFELGAFRSKEGCMSAFSETWAPLTLSGTWLTSYAQ
jgi:hypothetical protein